MSARTQMREVRPMDKLSTRLVEIQRGVIEGGVIAGRGIRVTQTPAGVIVEADTAQTEESSGTTEQTMIPCWG